MWAVANDHIEPDTKDWTWVLDHPCPEGGLDAVALAVEDLPLLLEGTTRSRSDVLGRDDVRERPGSGVWAPLEYAAHVRDVHQVFDERLRLMLSQDGPHVADRDQDETAPTAGPCALTAASSPSRPWGATTSTTPCTTCGTCGDEAGVGALCLDGGVTEHPDPCRPSLAAYDVRR